MIHESTKEAVMTSSAQPLKRMRSIGTQWRGMPLRRVWDETRLHLLIPELEQKWLAYIADGCTIDDFHTTAMELSTGVCGLLQRSLRDYGVSLTIHRIADHWVMFEANDEYLVVNLYCETVAEHFRNGPGAAEDISLSQVNPEHFTPSDLSALLWLGHLIKFDVIAEMNI
jgi:hypothetical protein